MALRDRRLGSSRVRGASMVEYAVVLVAVLLLAAGSFKLLGGRVGTRSNTAGNVVAGEGSGGGSGKGGGGGKGAGGGNPTVASKVNVGGMGQGADHDSPNSTRDTSSETSAAASGSGRDPGGNADVSETFTPKRWMGIGLLAAGVIALGYVVSSVRRTKKAADAAGPSKDSAGSLRSKKR